ncbi:MAG TPA: hypothetical protein VGA04_26540 [Streptosporangiaceae bacterium]
MPVVLILASAAILAGVVGVAIGRGGEMAEFAGDYPPCEADDLMTAADVALLRPPSALWGYNVQATDEALGRIAQVVTERDVEIAALRRQLAEQRAAVTPADNRSADAAPSSPVPASAPPASAAPAGAAPADADAASADAGTGSSG